MPYLSRANFAKNPVAKSLFEIMDLKKTNLCFAADSTKSEEILNVVEKVGPYICVLKTHVDIVEDFSEGFVNSLKSLAKKHNFLILEDRKFADIGNTVGLQYSQGIYRISEWADLVTVHSLPGQGILKGLKASLGEGVVGKRGCLLLAEFSSEGNLITPQYTAQTIKMATESADVDFIAGMVAQSKDSVPNPGLIQLTPGCKIEEGVDNLGQKYNSPETVVIEKGGDFIVVGRGILSSKNPEETAKLYRDRLWAAYEKRIAAGDN
jgi:uridine monophosphate synthetase